MPARYVCGDEGRRAAVRDSSLNGIDFLEVSEDQLTLAVHFLNTPAPAGITAANVAIEGGIRVTDIQVTDVVLADEALEVTVDAPGDFSTYTLRLASVQDLDPRLSAVPFSFKVDCPSDFDCLVDLVCPPGELAEPEINYLAKDYATFRRLILDRLSVIAPDWQERNPADLGIALVELLAYVGDQLSYYQDAVATEAYLGTARLRTSVRRHARLVDYFMHEGANARAWITFDVNDAGDGAILSGPDPGNDQPGTLVLTRVGPAGATLTPEQLPDAVNAGATFFELMHDVTLFQAHNEIRFYTWSDRECCLPAGATAATLLGPLPDLSPGDPLLFEEVLGPKTGVEEDADPTHRHVVRLTSVQAGEDPLDGTPVVDIEWDPADALPFPLCLSARTDDEHGAEYIEDVVLASANVALADHGLTLLEQTIGTVPEDRPFRPTLERGPLTHAVPLPENYRDRPASEVVGFEPQHAMPEVRLQDADSDTTWEARGDLLGSDRFARHFVAEMDAEGRATLRFGDKGHGRAPAADTAFTASYRVGNGLAGNVGAEALAHVVTNQGGIDRVSNPLPAWGGQAPEALEEVRQFAPQAFRVQQRAVTGEDYARVAERHPEVQRAAATFRWTGSWDTVFVTIDRRGGRPVDEHFERRLREHLNFFRMAGYDLEVNAPQFVPLDLAMTVCVNRGYFRSDVKVALLERFSNRILADDRLGFFHPDNWTFGQPIYLSRIYAAASEVAGVKWVEVERFQRWGKVANQELETGVLSIGRLEIVQLDNDPNFQEHGLIEFNMLGGS